MSQETERYQLENNGNSYLVRTTASGGGTDVEANPEGTATEDLEKLQVGDTIYGIPEGTEVAANPVLAGNEPTLTGLQVGDTKYAVESGMTNPMTTRGDIIYGGANGTATRLAPPNLSHDWLKYDNIQNTPVWTQITKDDIYINSGNQHQTMYVSSNSGGYSLNLGKPGQNFGLGYLTTAPTADNTDGLKIVVLTSEPATYYNGYYYIIAPTP